MFTVAKNFFYTLLIFSQFYGDENGGEKS